MNIEGNQKNLQWKNHRDSPLEEFSFVLADHQSHHFILDLPSF